MGKIGRVIAKFEKGIEQGFYFYDCEITLRIQNHPEVFKPFTIIHVTTEIKRIVSEVKEVVVVHACVESQCTNLGHSNSDIYYQLHQ